jgi:hypothetical protein
MRAAQALQGVVIQLQTGQALAGGGAIEVQAAHAQAYRVGAIELAEAVYALVQVFSLQTCGQGFSRMTVS